MNPLKKESIMTPAAYMFFILPVLIIVSDPLSIPDWFLYGWLGSTFVVAFLWNNLYLWRTDDGDKP
jgi:hypothetical protein